MHRLMRQVFVGTLARTRRRRGQALVEFAIVAPVMVTTLLFAIYFYELIQIKLKTQEIARFAAWEFTGYPLHDYHSGKPNQFSGVRSSILQDAGRRYANLKSGDTGNQNKVLAVEWSAPQIRARDQDEPRIPGGNLANKVFTAATTIIDLLAALAYAKHADNLVFLGMMGIHTLENSVIFGARTNIFNPPKRWGFNTKGYPTVTVRLRYNNLMIPTSFMEGNTGWYTARHFKITRRHFEETVTLVADSWRLHQGEDVKGPRDQVDSSNTAYFKQVERMAFVSPGIQDVVGGALQVVAYVMDAIQLIAMHPPLFMKPTETTLVSIAYGRDNQKGTVTIQEDDKGRPYDTMPFKPGSEYEKSYDKRGNNFMGCNEPEKLGCFDSLSQNNPFGDFVEPPPETP